MSDNYKFKKLNEELAGKYALRVVEAKSTIDVVRALVKLNKRYGANHKISFALIGGHGSPDSIRFGAYQRGLRHELYIDDLKGKGAQRAGEFFEENPTIMLASCSTGQEGGIAEELANSLGARVIAPDKPTSLSRIEVSFDEDGKISFDIKYSDEGVEKTYLGSAT